MNRRRLLIDGRGVIRARWFDSIHGRVGPNAIIEALKKLRESDGQPQRPAAAPERNRN